MARAGAIDCVRASQRAPTEDETMETVGCTNSKIYRDGECFMEKNRSQSHSDILLILSFGFITTLLLDVAMEKCRRRTNQRNKHKNYNNSLSLGSSSLRRCLPHAIRKRQMSICWLFECHSNSTNNIIVKPIMQNIHNRIEKQAISLRFLFMISCFDQLIIVRWSRVNPYTDISIANETHKSHE